MPQTSISGTSSYCTVAQFLERNDQRCVGDYLSDSGQRLTPSEVLASTTLANLLKEASGELESALLRGGRHTPADLQALTGNSAQKLVGIVAGYTMFLVWNRRPGSFINNDLPAGARKAVEDLDNLSMGERILAFQETADAGRISHHVETESDVVARGGIAWIARRFFGRRTSWRDG